MSNKSRPKILVVNDDPGSLIGMTGLLSQWTEELSFDIFSARSGEEALRHVLKHDFAFILLDVNMPGMNGFETANAIHSRKASATTPIIFATAYLADEMNRLKGYEQGAADYLFTPVIPQVLKAKLSVFVSLAQQKLMLKDQAAALDHRAQELTAINSQLEAEIGKRRIAEEKNKTAEEFLAMLGHELRNPLAAVNSACSLINLPGIGPQQTANALQIIQRQTGQLTRIVEDLLDLGRIVSGKIRLSKRAVDLSKLVQTCVETLAVSGRTTNHIVDVKAESAHIDADSARMEQIVTNLLDNALKYTPAGGRIDVEVRTESEQVVLSVRDSGIGMSPDLLSKIFDIFVQGEQPLDRPQGGLGIGLALVQQLVALHGGTITAASDKKDKGSVFVVRLPRSMKQESVIPDSPDQHVENHYGVLLIDDNEDGREITSILLTSVGFRVFTAGDGISGIQTALSDAPSVAFIDIGLPGIDGYEVARRLRADPRTSAIKLIAMTGYGSENDRLKAIEAGFDMHLVKPASTDRIINAISQCMAGSTVS